MSEVEGKRPWCEWAELHQDECDHCQPGRIVEPKTAEKWADEDYRAWLLRAIHDATTTAIYPLPADRTPKPKGASMGGPRWKPENVAAEIGGHLTAIENMFAALHDEAETRHSDREFPGGDALVMLGPGPGDVEAFDYRQISALVGRISEKDVVIADQRDIEPPLSFLAGWSDIIREERDQPTALRATISREVSYIRKSIDWLVSDDENGEARFLPVDDLAQGLGTIRRRMEDILKDGTRSEFTRVKCISPECETHPRLMKLWAAQVRWDRYRCPECRTTYNTKQFNQAKAQNLHDDGASRFVRPVDAMKASGVPKNTMRSWMRRGDVLVAFEAPTWNRLVWWPDVRTRAVERTARLKAEAIERARREAENEAKKKAEEDGKMSA